MNLRPIEEKSDSTGTGDLVSPRLEEPSAPRELRSPRHRRIVAGGWSNAVRIFFALWFLLGSLVHVKYGLTNQHIYEGFGRTSLFDFSRELWTAVVMPHITFFALLLAAFEMVTGILILSKGRYVVTGLAASVAFSLFLVQLGLGFPEIPWSARDFFLNRATTLVFALLQAPLFWVHFDKSFPEFLSARWRGTKRQSQAKTRVP